MYGVYWPALDRALHCGYPWSMFNFDDEEIRRFERDLDRFKHRAFPFATKQTVNEAAKGTRRIAVLGFKQDLTLRNKFTVQSVQFDLSKTLNVRHQAATVGSIAGYMESMEFGAIKTKKGGVGTPIATPYASGESMDAMIRTRLPRKAHTMRAIQLARRRKSTSRKQRNAIAVQQAAKGGRKFVYLDLGRTKGIFKVVGGKRNPTPRMVWNLSHQSVVIPRRPWLKPATDEIQLRMPNMYKAALKFQLRKHGLFNGR